MWVYCRGNTGIPLIDGYCFFLIFSNIANNPLLCDCGLRWLPGFLNNTPPLIPLRGSCDAPASLNGNELRSLNEEDFVCGKFCVLQCILR